jgi:hypothetical protein
MSFKILLSMDYHLPMAPHKQWIHLATREILGNDVRNCCKCDRECNCNLSFRPAIAFATMTVMACDRHSPLGVTAWRQFVNNNGNYNHPPREKSGDDHRNCLPSQWRMATMKVVTNSIVEAITIAIATTHHSIPQWPLHLRGIPISNQ